MAVLPDTTDSNALNTALDTQMILNFQQQYNRLAEILGIFNVEVMQAGAVLNTITYDGTLTDASSYVEGDEVSLTKIEAKKTPIGEVTPAPYRKLTTAQAIVKSGYETAVMGTDRKMLNLVRNSILEQFFNDLTAITGTTAGGTGLQHTLAVVDATLGDALESNNDASDRLVHFINRQDAAEYLGKATITDQSVFGMTYLENFLGISNVLLTNKVAKGKIIATPAENIHVYGLDFSALANSGLSYASDENGLIGVAHTPAYDRVSAETHVLTGTRLFAEVSNYIVTGDITPIA